MSKSNKGTTKMQQLLAKVTGGDVAMTETEALASIAPVEDASTKALMDTVNIVNVAVEANRASESLYDQAVAMTSAAAEITMLDKAYAVSFDVDTRQYFLHTIAFNDKGDSKYVGKELFARYLPEVHTKLGRLFIEPLAQTMRPSYKR